MSALSDLVNEQAEADRGAVYDELADAALQVFGVAAHEVLFLGHNSGAAFRIEAADGRRLLLKVHAPQGESEALTERAVLGGLAWLATIAEVAQVPVQEPVPDPTGALLPTVSFRGVPLPCSLQRWLDGHQVEELSPAQARAVGDLMGRWHACSERRVGTAEGAVTYDSRYLERMLDDLRVLEATGAVTDESWHTIEQATALAGSVIDTIGTSAEVYGVVHGDLNPDNVIVAADGAVQFIDLAQLVVAPYLWDVGVALYQYSYQDAAVRRALVAGYRDGRPGLVTPPLALEVFVCAAALANLAFQSSIPAQRTSTLFHTNVHRFATGYCRNLVDGLPFALE
ncbi:phosphotransferase enzyme family protein [Nocardioides cynanchi]|uniref:phosphotransferase enzyme family protein n=1 Tax=Nocardioides cynanchi TaxID=2558918 RepID=UPI00177F4585|nr:phosphotransferase [Nocardioides cynanchi]